MILQLIKHILITGAVDLNIRCLESDELQKIRLIDNPVLIETESEAHRQRKNCDYKCEENTLFQASEDVLA